MGFQVSLQLEREIKEVLKNNPELQNKLLSGDPEEIRKFGEESRKGINPKEVIEALENEQGAYLLRLARKKVACIGIYEKLCKEYDQYSTSKRGGQGRD